MHAESFFAMNHALTLYKVSSARVLDVGSRSINGTYRPMVEDRGWLYTGLDIVAGDNVDIVSEDPYRYPFHDGAFDVVISGNALHNMAAFWRVVPEMVRVLRSGGLLAIVAVTWGKPPSGAYPADYWRFQPAGLQFLFDETRQLERIAIEGIPPYDLLATAWKVSNA